MAVFTTWVVVLICHFIWRILPTTRLFWGASSDLEVVAWLLFAAAMLIVLAIRAAFPLSELIGTWVSRFYMPAAKGIPPLSYILAES